MILTPMSALTVSLCNVMVVEWDLRCEPLDQWEYLTESRIKTLDNGVYEKVLAVVNRVHSALEE